MNQTIALPVLKAEGLNIYDAESGNMICTAPPFEYDKGSAVLAEINTEILRQMAFKSNHFDKAVELLGEFIEVCPCQNGCEPDDMSCVTQKSKALLTTIREQKNG